MKETKEEEKGRHEMAGKTHASPTLTFTQSLATTP
jgi:hypothetical protein